MSRELDDLRVQVAKAKGYVVVVDWPCYPDPEADHYCMATTSEDARVHLNKPGYDPYKDSSYPSRQPAFQINESMCCLPDWSTDMNAADELWDEMIKAGHMVELTEDDPDDVYCSIYKMEQWGASKVVEARNDDGLIGREARCNAICKAYVEWHK